MIGADAEGKKEKQKGKQQGKDEKKLGLIIILSTHRGPKSWPAR
jgi:hypothetical protein